MSLPAPRGISHAPRLRPLAELRALDAPGAGRASRRGRREDGAENARDRARSRILIAGANCGKRAAVLRDLRETLPADTRFVEAGAVWEVLEQASSCGVVMLADDLGEVSAQSLMRMLGERHPGLPVIALGRWPAPLDGDPRKR